MTLLGFVHYVLVVSLLSQLLMIYLLCASYFLVHRYIQH